MIYGRVIPHSRAAFAVIGFVADLMKGIEEEKPDGQSKARGAVIATVVALAVFSGCAVGPNYQRPSVIAPDNYRFAPARAPLSLGQLPWWEVFKDAALQELIRAALTNNYDLKQAVARVEQARNVAVVAGASLIPQIGYGGDVGRGRNALINSPAPLNGLTESSAQVNLNVVWEIDFWGRIRRLSESARAQYLATEEARRGVTLTLVSDVATAYFQISRCRTAVCDSGEGFLRCQRRAVHTQECGNRQ